MASMAQSTSWKLLGYSPPSSMSRYSTFHATAPVLACDVGRSCDRCVDASPLAHACAGHSRIVLVQAPDPYDGLVPEAQALAMAAALADAGAAVELIVPAPAQLETSGCPADAGIAHGFSGCLFDGSSGPVLQGLTAAVGPQ